MNQENTTPEEFEFREGDICEHVITGAIGELRSNKQSQLCPLYCKELGSVSLNGRSLGSLDSKYPSIRLIKRPKKQKKIEVVRWLNIYPGGDIVAHDSSDEASENANPKAIAVAVEMRGHYFIEEE